MIIWFWRRRCSSRSRRRWRSASNGCASPDAPHAACPRCGLSGRGRRLPLVSKSPGRSDTRLQLAVVEAAMPDGDHSATGVRPGGPHAVLSGSGRAGQCAQRSSSRSSRAMRRTRANRRRLRLRSRMMRRASSNRLRSCGSRSAEAGRVSFSNLRAAACHACISCRRLLRLLGLLAALTLGNSCILNSVLNLTLQVAAKAVLLHQVAALPDERLSVGGHSAGANCRSSADIAAPRG
jgi:hypothetical protein